MASDPVQKVLRAARQGKGITLNASETRQLAGGLMGAALRLRAYEDKDAPKTKRWWRR